jgi:hypothetical protein
MTKRECRRLAWLMAYYGMVNYIENDCHCPATKSGCWTDLSEADYVRLTDEMKRLAQEFFQKGRPK